MVDGLNRVRFQRFILLVRTVVKIGAWVNFVSCVWNLKLIKEAGEFIGVGGEEGDDANGCITSHGFDSFKNLKCVDNHAKCAWTSWLSLCLVYQAVATTYGARENLTSGGECVVREGIIKLLKYIGKACFILKG